jgi:nucleotide-binding universal stress UspA family protein
MILVGTDFSPASEPALVAAAAIAKKQGEYLLLVTVVEHAAAERIMADVRLERDAAQLRHDFGIEVECCVLEGAPDRELLALAAERSPSLIVVGAEGASQRSRRLGSVAEELSQRAAAPVLVVRESESLAAWSRSARPLRVLLGSGIGDASRSALDYVSGWPELALTVAHVAWPYGEHYRLGTAGPMPLDHLRPEVHRRLVDDLSSWVGAHAGVTPPKLCVVPGWGRIDSHLAQLAAEQETDLLVVGSHQRELGERVWHGSVSRSVIHEASGNVLCVPRTAPTNAASGPRVIVVPTDFSALADRAIPVANGLLRRGDALHLIIVTPPSPEEPGPVLARLAERLPKDAKARGIETEVHVLGGVTPWLSIWQYAGRAGADMICMATRSRDRVSSLVLGSQAQSLLQHARIPVVLVPPDREG